MMWFNGDIYRYKNNSVCITYIYKYISISFTIIVITPQLQRDARSYIRTKYAAELKSIKKLIMYALSRLIDTRLGEQQ